MKCVAEIQAFTKDGFPICDAKEPKVYRCSDHIAEKLVSTRLWVYTPKSMWKANGRKYRMFS